ncbi:hypothetical protein L7F22_009736 [Adiantum nelumboides]|nr:hypothetical protein [Adiantum nelumboides]
MANAGPDTNGSQFFMIYGDAQLPPNYTVFGSIGSEGLATLDKVAKGGESVGSGDGVPSIPVPEVLRVAHLEGEPGHRDAVAGGGRRRREDVDLLVGEHLRDVGEQPVPVERLDLDGDQEHRLRRHRPRDVDEPFLRGEVPGVGAVGAVHADPAAAGDEAEDLVARHGGAAAGELDVEVAEGLPVLAADDDAGVPGRPALADRRRGGPLGELLLGVLLAAEPRDQALHDVLGAGLVLADGGVERGDVGVVHLAGQRGHGVAGDQPLQRHPGAARLPGDRLLALLDGLLAALLGEPLLDLGLGPRRLGDLQPVPRGPGVLGLRGEDLDDVAGRQLPLQGDELAVDPGADAAVPDLGVHGVGQVDRGGAGGQRDDVALRREHEDLPRGEVEAQRVEELAGVGGLALPVEQLAHPRHLLDLDLLVAAALDLLVPPVRGDAVLGGAVHVVGADLHLEGLAVRPDHRGVQRLVDAEPGLGDVVLEPAGHRLPQRVHHADRGVAVAHLVDEHADADEVVDVVEVATLDDHLAVDRVVVLRPALDGRGDPRGVQLQRHLVDDLAQVGVARRRPVGDQPDDLLVLLGLQDREGQVLQLQLDRGHAEAVRQRGEHLQGLAGLLGLLLRAQEAHRAHVVQPVGQLDDQHPRVAGHRDDHLADRLGLRGGAELDLVELGDAVDEVRDLVAEVGAQPVQGVVGVLDGVVQQRRDQRRGVHAQLGQDRGDGERVGDVGVAGLAALPLVLVLGDVVGALEQHQVGLGVQGTVDRGERLQHRLDDRDPLRRHPPRDPGPDPAGGGRARRLVVGRQRARGRMGAGPVDLGHRTSCSCSVAGRVPGARIVRESGPVVVRRSAGRRSAGHPASPGRSVRPAPAACRTRRPRPRRRPAGRRRPRRCRRWRARRRPRRPACPARRPRPAAPGWRCRTPGRSCATRRPRAACPPCGPARYRPRRRARRRRRAGTRAPPPRSPAPRAAGSRVPSGPARRPGAGRPRSPRRSRARPGCRRPVPRSSATPSGLAGRAGAGPRGGGCGGAHGGEGIGGRIVLDVRGRPAPAGRAGTTRLDPGGLVADPLVAQLDVHQDRGGQQQRGDDTGDHADQLHQCQIGQGADTEQTDTDHEQAEHRQDRDERGVHRPHQRLVQREVRGLRVGTPGQLQQPAGVLPDLVEHDDGVVEREPEDGQQTDHGGRGDLQPDDRVHPGGHDDVVDERDQRRGGHRPLEVERQEQRDQDDEHRQRDQRLRGDLAAPGARDLRVADRGGARGAVRAERLQLGEQGLAQRHELLGGQRLGLQHDRRGVAGPDGLGDLGREADHAFVDPVDLLGADRAVRPGGGQLDLGSAGEVDAEVEAPEHQREQAHGDEHAEADVPGPAAADDVDVRGAGGEPGPARQRLGEHDDEVQHRGHAEGEREAADLADGQDVEHRGGEEADRVGGEDRAPRALPGPRHRGPEGSALAHLVLEPFEEDHERVGRDADGDDEPGDAREVEGEPDPAPEQDQHRVDDHAGQDQRQDRQHAEQAVVEQAVDEHQHQADGAGDEPGLQRRQPQGRRHGLRLTGVERQRQRAVAQRPGEVLGPFLVELTGDLGRAVDRLVDRGGRDDVAVEDERDVLADVLGRVPAPGVGALRLEGQPDHPADALLVLLGLGGGDLGALEERRAEQQRLQLGGLVGALPGLAELRDLGGDARVVRREPARARRRGRRGCRRRVLQRRDLRDRRDGTALLAHALRLRRGGARGGLARGGLAGLRVLARRGLLPGGLVRGDGALQHLAEAQLRGLAQGAGLLAGVAGDGDDDVAAVQLDLGAADTEPVDALLDDVLRLDQLVTRRWLPVGGAGGERDAGATLQVDAQLRREVAAPVDRRLVLRRVLVGRLGDGLLRRLVGRDLLPDRRTQPGGDHAVGDLEIDRVLVRGVDDGAPQPGRGDDDVAVLQRLLHRLRLRHLPALLAAVQEQRHEQQQDDEERQQGEDARAATGLLGED